MKDTHRSVVHYTVFSAAEWNCTLMIVATRISIYSATEAHVFYYYARTGNVNFLGKDYSLVSTINGVNLNAMLTFLGGWQSVTFFV